jgi:hypothetical protein
MNKSGVLSQMTGELVSSFDQIDENNIIVSFESYNDIRFKINFKCDQEDLVYESYHDYTLSVRSKVGCPSLSLSAIYPWIMQNKDWLSIFVVAFALVLCFFGTRFFKVALFCIGFIAVFFFLMVCIIILIHKDMFLKNHTC